VDGRQENRDKRLDMLCEPCTCDVIDNLMDRNLISVVNFALAHSKLDKITPNFAHALPTSIICFSIFFCVERVSRCITIP